MGRKDSMFVKQLASPNQSVQNQFNFKSEIFHRTWQVNNKIHMEIQRSILKKIEGNDKVRRLASRIPLKL